MNPDRLVEVALEVARGAGELVLGGYRTRPAASEKGRADLVTEYDVRSDSFIRSSLSAATPGLAIVTEESGGEARGVTWYCDPIDGTMNFVHGHPFFCVSVGAMDEEGPVAGAVVAPALGLEWWGGRGAGAFRNGAPCRVSETASLAGSLVATGFPHDRGNPSANNLRTFTEVIPLVHDVRRCGSAAIDCCLVADGTYDAYWERELHAWDLAAGCAIALAAGARLTSRAGGAPNLHVGHLVLSNGRVHDALVACVRD